MFIPVINVLFIFVISNEFIFIRQCNEKIRKKEKENGFMKK